MKNFYQHIITTICAVLFLVLLYGIAQSIAFMDNAMGYFGDYQAFADTILTNNKFLLGISVASVIICIIYGLIDIFHWKFAKRTQFGLSLILLILAAYLFIVVVGLRKQAYSIDSYSAQTAFTLYQNYRSISLMVVFSQFLLSLNALCRSVYQFILLHRPDQKEEQA